MNNTITLQSSTNQDLDFLRQVYADSRAEEMSRSGWPQANIDQFLGMQFELQHKQYQEHYSGADFDLILADREPIGRLYVHRTSSEIRIMDIAILTPWKRRGIGSWLLKQLIAESVEKKLPLGLHAESNNPILPYYERLGFVKGELRGVYYYLERPPRILQDN